MIANSAVQFAAKGRVVVDLRPLAEDAFRLERLQAFKVVVSLVEVADVRHQQGAFGDAEGEAGSEGATYPKTRQRRQRISGIRHPLRTPWCLAWLLPLAQPLLASHGGIE